MQLAKGQGVTVFVIGHVNKEGSIAGPKVLEHMVDCVLYFEGDSRMTYRILRAAKNRFDLDLRRAESLPIADVPRHANYQPVRIDTNMEDLVDKALNQNFVPVVDDRGMFIGIVRRQAIIRYCYDRSRAAAAEQRRKPESVSRLRLGCGKQERPRRSA